MRLLNLTLFPMILAFMVCTSSCHKETQRPEAAISHFLLNDSAVVLSDGHLTIDAGCKIYTLTPSPEPEAATVFVSINDHAFSRLDAPLILHDSIEKVSAYATHPDFRKSATINLNVDFTSRPFNDRVSLFPNPASDYTTLNMESSYRGPIRLRIMDVRGTILYQIEGAKSDEFFEIKIDLSDLNAGLYFYKLGYDACELTGKIIVEI